MNTDSKFSSKSAHSLLNTQQHDSQQQHRHDFARRNNQVNASDKRTDGSQTCGLAYCSEQSRSRPSRAKPAQASRCAAVGVPNKLINSKKSQFYIFTAIVLIAYATLLVTPGSVTPDASRNFKNVFENFVFESSAAINNALFERKDIISEYVLFLDSFVSYSKMKKLNIEVLGIVAEGNQIYVVNKMVSSVKILQSNETVLSDSTSTLLRADYPELVLEVYDDVFHENIYKFAISQKGVEHKALLRVSKGSKRDIFVKD